MYTLTIHAFSSEVKGGFATAALFAKHFCCMTNGDALQQVRRWFERSNHTKVVAKSGDTMRISAMGLLFGLAVFSSISAGEKDAKIALFNGKDLDGWIAEGTKDFKDKDGVKNVWSVRDGLLVCDGRGFGFLRYTPKKFGNFHFHVEYRMAAKCNSGVGVRTVAYDPKKSTETRPSYACYEIQLLDDAGKPPNKHSSGSLYRYVAPTSNPVKAVGEWNTLDIECDGPKIRVRINGEKIIDVDQGKIDDLKDKPLEGFVCLQNHGGRIEFRDLWVRELAPTK
jgi:hypothetical protein